MYGVPKVCKTAKDFERVHELAKAGKLPAGEMIKQWQGLYNTRSRYVFDRVLDTDEDPDGPEPDYRVLAEEKEDGTTERRQFKLAENPSGRIFKLGYDPDKVQAKIEELGG